MCNAFNTAKKIDQISVPFDGGSSRPLPVKEDYQLIRRTDQTAVILPDGEVKEMRWGFQRKAFGVVNNTRSDNLESPMWREAFAERPCLIPLISYYEWSGPKGRKRTHLFRNGYDEWLFAAGIWEEASGPGLCCSMLTTDANALVSPIHHRMPALLGCEEMERYLKGELLQFAPATDLLTVEASVNPLLRNPPDQMQGELF